MITGECPYNDCSELHMVPMAPHTPAFSKESCDACGREYWMLHSRINPVAMTLEEFESKYIVDGKTIKDKAGEVNRG